MQAEWFGFAGSMPEDLREGDWAMPEYSGDMGKDFRETAPALFGPLYGKPAAVLEVGAFEGHTAAWLLDNVLTHPDAKYVGVEIDAARRDKAARNLASYGDKALVLLGDSAVVLGLLAAWGWRFEAAYVDGDHREIQAHTDFAAVWPLLEPGGFMLADDYGHLRFPVKAALDGFLAGLPAGSWEWLLRGYQAAVRRTPCLPLPTNG